MKSGANGEALENQVPNGWMPVAAIDHVPVVQLNTTSTKHTSTTSSHSGFGPGTGVRTAITKVHNTNTHTATPAANAP